MAPRDIKKTKDKKGKDASLFSYAVPASIEEIVGKTGMRGEITQVRCKVLEGRDQN
ncbi:hypothetical protein HN953_02175, partial [Candidatus Woesearchaeota archaeon]|nr:hypothetical protein [Candidatus Woesearchaeota archaeon]